MGSGPNGGGERGDLPVALVADSSPVESRALARALAEHGYRVICVATPLEMIHHLEYRRGELGLVVLGASLGRFEGEELASFLAEAHPQLRRVSVARRACSGAKDAAAALLGSLLEKPWTEDLIRSALAPELEWDVRPGERRDDQGPS